jgi:type IV secretory pathway TrbD component
MSEWIASGAAVESGPEIPLLGRRAPARRSPPMLSRMGRPGDRALALLDALAARPVGHLLAAWLLLALGFGIVYWVAGVAGAGGLMEHGAMEPASARGLLSALYFSFITAMSVGYGDVLPVGAMRVLAILEAAAGLLIFGFVISKFVSRRQEEVIDEIHRIAFEDRLGRVQTGLHLALGEMQALAALCADGAQPPPRTLARAESVALVFARELRVVHDLLYRPQQQPDEEALEAILVTLAATYREMHDLVECMPPAAVAASGFRRSLGAIARLGTEICGECVPREHAPALREWMDQIQESARRLPGAGGR